MLFLKLDKDLEFAFVLFSFPFLPKLLLRVVSFPAAKRKALMSQTVIGLHFLAS